MNHSLRARSAHDVGEGWSCADATELYEIARWGQGYFGIGENGQVLGQFASTGIRPRFLEKLRIAGVELPPSTFD